jgi:hypothetical protein
MYPRAADLQAILAPGCGPLDVADPGLVEVLARLADIDVDRGGHRHDRSSRSAHRCIDEIGSRDDRFRILRIQVAIDTSALPGGAAAAAAAATRWRALRPVNDAGRTLRAWRSS